MLIAEWDFFGQTFVAHDIVVIGLLVLLEGVLSIDNALVLGILAKRLPKREQGRALTYGLVGAVVFRFIAVLTASLLLKWTFVKFLGGAYLVYIAVKHLFFESKETEETEIKQDEEGVPHLVQAETGKPLSREAEDIELEERVPIAMDAETRKRLGLARFWPTVLVIELTDIAFAVDSILAAIALVGSPPEGHAQHLAHPKLWVIYVGGILGVLLMRVAAVIFIQLLERFPRFELSAYLLVIVIGVKLLADWTFNSDWSFSGSPMAQRGLGRWSQTFADIETSRRKLATGYEQWQQKSWPPYHWSQHHDPVPTIEQNRQVSSSEEAHAPAESIPHVLDFHSPSPESFAFWSTMLICFLVGFLPTKDKKKNDQAKKKEVLGTH